MAIQRNPDRGLAQYEDGSWGIDFRVGPKRFRRKVGSKQDARRLYHKIKLDLAKGDTLLLEKPTVRRTVGQLIAEYLKTVTDRGYRSDLGFWTGFLGHLYPGQVLPEHLQAWVLAQRGKLKPASVLRKLAPLRRIYSLAVRRGEVSLWDNPFRDYSLLGLPKRLNNEREVQLEPEQEQALWGALGATWCEYAEFAILTGLRWGNQFDLRRDDLDLKRGIAMVPKTKSGEKQAIQLSTRAQEILIAQLARHTSDWVFCSPTGKRWHAGNWATRVWRPALRRAGIAHLHWHDLRHTHAGRLVEAGRSLYTVQKSLGQRDPRTAQRYAYLGDRALREAAEDVAARTSRPVDRFSI